MKSENKITIVVCASASSYKLLPSLESELQLIGFKVILPKTARKMIKSGDFNIEKHKVWYKDPSLFNIKTNLMKTHFKEIEKADAILVANFEKNGIKGYIGGNTLMEMTLAFYLKKPIFILNSIDNDSPIMEEIYGVNPNFLSGNLMLINGTFSKTRRK